jgi:hypothetical protein
MHAPSYVFLSHTGTVAMTKFSSLGVHAFHEWAGDVIDVLNAPVYPKKTEKKNINSFI